MHLRIFYQTIFCAFVSMINVSGQMNEYAVVHNEHPPVFYELSRHLA